MYAEAALHSSRWDGGWGEEKKTWGRCGIHQIKLERRRKTILGMTPLLVTALIESSANIVVAGNPLYGKGPVEREFMRYYYSPH